MDLDEKENKDTEYEYEPETVPESSDMPTFYDKYKKPRLLPDDALTKKTWIEKIKDTKTWWDPIKEKLTDWFDWLPCLKPDEEMLKSQREEPPPKRYIYCGETFDDADSRIKAPHLEDEEQTDFCSNYVSTTKYSIVTFVPINLFEQFQKKANFYFLIIAILSFTDLSPKNPIFSVAPLTFVLLVSAAKEAYEDHQRYEMDKEINNRQVLTWRPANDNGSLWEWVYVVWQELRVGDIVKITKKERAFPADLLLLQSSKGSGICNIETSNLDGETNLKLKQASASTFSIDADEDGDKYMFDPKLNFKLESEAPNEKMDKSSWKGALYFASDPDEPKSVGFNQLLLRGCTLRNTEWIIGMVMFTGSDTKLMLNNKLRPFKRSNVDLIVDQALYLVFGVQALLCLFGWFSHYVWLSQNANDQWYQYVKKNGTNEGNYFFQGFKNTFTFLVLLDLFVPISLYVSMELVKFIQAFLINQDSEMKHINDNDDIVYAQARTSNLNEELGQINFIFSDKTGTLTQNKMEFIRCHVDGIRYGPGEMEKQRQNISRIETPKNMPPFDNKKCRFTDNRLAHNSKKSKIVQEFLTLLCTCHSIIPEYPEGDKGPIIYQASSPDEKALVLLAKNLHYYFFDAHTEIFEFRDKSVQGQQFKCNIMGEELCFDIYNMLEFSSARKRMSVVVRDPRDKKFKLFCKGADNVIFERLTKDEKENQNSPWPSCLESLKYFAADGLRTLVCAYKELTDDEYYNWLVKYLKAKATLENREALVDEAYNLIECNLRLLGSTAIEDRLQDGVPDTIANLAVAGISIWVLTGDKVETAINIGRSCRLISPAMTRDNKKLYVIDPDEKLSYDEAKKITSDKFDDAWNILKDNPENDPTQAIVISGKALSFVFPPRKRDTKGKEIPPTPEQAEEEAIFQEKVLRICRKCRAVLCCRVSPIQKSQMVLLVKNNVRGTITLAIGDGANDVPMIKAAHVGIGISGQEGLQAVMASDYAIAQFRFLEILLLIHGAWDYRRTSVLILYSFYKNIMFSLTQIWFAFFCGFSGTLYYDAFSGSCYNLVFTCFPPLLAAVFDRPYSKKIATLCPELYENGPQNASFNLKIFGLYFFQGMCNSLAIFFTCVYFIDGSSKSNGQVMGFWVSNTTMFTSIVTVATLKMMLETKTWTNVSIGFFAASEAAWFLFSIVWSSIPVAWGYGNSDIFGVFKQALGLPIYWFVVLLAVSFCVIPECIVRYIQRMYFPSRLNVIEELESYPVKRKQFINEIENYKKKQNEQLDVKREEDVQQRDKNDLGYTDFQVGFDHTDFILPQVEAMRAELKHKNKKKKKKKEKKKRVFRY